MIRLNGKVNESYLQMYGITSANSEMIEVDGVPVGIIDYSVTDTMVKITYIRVEDTFRRQGIAKAVIEQLKMENVGKYMYGDALPEAISFWESMGAEFDEDPEEDYLTPFHIEC